MVSLSTVLAMLDAFQIAKYTLLGVLGIALVYGFTFTRRRMQERSHEEGVQRDANTRLDFVAWGLAAAFAVYVLLRSHAHVAGGHDPGIHLLAAWNLMETGSLRVTFTFASSFPGFHRFGDTIDPQFLPGFIAYLGLSMAWLGVQGYRLGLAILALMNILALYYATKMLGLRHAALIAIVLVLSGLVFLHFSRVTFSENLAFLLFWGAVFLALSDLGRQTFPVASVGVLSVYMLTRPEGILIFSWFAGTLLLIAVMRRGLRLPRRTELLPALSTLGLAGTGLLLLPQHFSSQYVSGQISRTWGRISNAMTSPANAAEGPFNPTLFGLVFQLALSVRYAVIALVVLAIVALVVVYFIQSTWSVRLRKRLLLVLVAAIPFLVFVLQPGVAHYEPWFSRRYLVGVIPLASLLAGAALEFLLLKSRLLGAGMTAAVLAASLIASAPLLGISYGGGVLEGLDDLASQLDDDSAYIFYGRFEIENFAPTIHFLFDKHAIIGNIPEPPATGNRGISKAEFNQILCTYKEVYIISSRPLGGATQYPYVRSEHLTLTWNHSFRSQVLPAWSDVRPMQSPESFQSYLDLFYLALEGGPSEQTRTYHFHVYSISDTYLQGYLLEVDC